MFAIKNTPIICFWISNCPLAFGTIFFGNNSSQLTVNCPCNQPITTTYYSSWCCPEHMAISILFIDYHWHEHYSFENKDTADNVHLVYCCSKREQKVYTVVQNGNRIFTFKFKRKLLSRCSSLPLHCLRAEGTFINEIQVALQRTKNSSFTLKEEHYNSSS